MRTTDLPIESALGPLIAALIQGTAAVLVAQPGAGKTTIVPLVLVEQPWCTGKVIVVEPRRVAARAAAGGRPSLATFAQAVSAAQGPLTGRSAALAQARYVALVRKMTAARAATQS